MSLEKGPSAQLSIIAVDQPPLPKISKIAEQPLTLRLKLHGWVLKQIAKDRETNPEKEALAAQNQRIHKYQEHLATIIRSEDMALAYIQTATPTDVANHPLFYRGLWELMKARGWNKERPIKRA